MAIADGSDIRTFHFHQTTYMYFPCVSRGDEFFKVCRDV